MGPPHDVSWTPSTDLPSVAVVASRCAAAGAPHVYEIAYEEVDMGTEPVPPLPPALVASFVPSDDLPVAPPPPARPEEAPASPTVEGEAPRRARGHRGAKTRATQTQQTKAAMAAEELKKALATTLPLDVDNSPCGGGLSSPNCRARTLRISDQDSDDFE